MMRASSPPLRRGGKKQKIFFLSFLFFAGGGGGGEEKKWKGNFWFCFAASETSKRVSFNFITFDYSFLRILAAIRGASSPCSVVALNSMASFTGRDNSISGALPYKIL